MSSDLAYPEPHAGITGIDRSGDPILSLDETSVSVRDLVAHLVDQLYGATLVGNRAPAVTDLHTRMTSPRAGDLVVITDSLYMRAGVDTRIKAVGYLVALRAEWWTTDEEWEREKADGEVYPDEPRPVERAAVYVQYGPAPIDICRWVNCTVLAAPPRMERYAV